MRYLVLGILFLSLTKIAFAENKTLSATKMERNYWLLTVCVDGYKFVVVDRTQSPSIAQVFIEKDGKSVPAKCN